MNTSIHRSTVTAAAETEALEVQVTQLWGDNVIAQKHASEGALSFAVSDGELELVRWMAGDLVVTAPGREPFVVRAGHSVDVVVGAMTFRVAVSAREGRPKRNVAAAILEDATIRTIAGSGALHAALLAAFAFFMPAMSSADEDVLDRERMLDLKAYIQSAAEREQEQKPEESAGESAPSGGDVGQRAKNEEGKAGGVTQTHEGRWAAKGDERPENATLARERALKEAADFGLAGILAAQLQSDPNAPVVPWGSVLAGSDRESHSGSLYGADFGDVIGNGLGLSGVGEGGGGSGQGIGLGNVGNLGTCATDQCTGGHGGIGRGHGPGGGGHVSRGPVLRWAKDIQTNGRLDPAVIQRIVRQNQGRFIGCYQQGLRTNPSLEGRVAVSFLIDRGGNVSIAQDTSGSDLPDSGVRSCVVKAFYNLSFPEPGGGTVRVSYPLTFTPADG